MKNYLSKIHSTCDSLDSYGHLVVPSQFTLSIVPHPKIILPFSLEYIPTLIPYAMTAHAMPIVVSFGNISKYHVVYSLLRSLPHFRSYGLPFTPLRDSSHSPLTMDYSVRSTGSRQANMETTGKTATHDDDWYPNLRATNHLTHNTPHVHDTEPYTVPGKVQIGSGNLLHITRIDTSAINTNDSKSLVYALYYILLMLLAIWFMFRSSTRIITLILNSMEYIVAFVTPL